MTAHTTVLATDTGGVNGVAVGVLVVLFLLVSVAGLRGRPLARAPSPRAASTSGAWAAAASAPSSPGS